MAQRAPLALKDIQRKTDITDEQLNSQIKPENHNQLAELFNDCDLYLDHPDFYLSEGDKVNILRNQNSNQEKVRMLLKIWRDRRIHECTFRKLIEILLQLEQGRIANEVANFLKSEFCLYIHTAAKL